MTNPTAYALADAELVDAALAAINTRLTGLAWLQTAYGQAQRLQEEKEGRLYIYPGIYTGGQGGGDYLDMMPDRHLAASGGYCWWDVAEQAIQRTWRQTPPRMEFRAGLVVWFDLRKVYPADWQGRKVWNVIQDVIDELKKGTGAAQLGEDVTFSYSAETIYPRYTHKEIERQFLMMPYGGFRMDATIFFNQSC